MKVYSKASDEHVETRAIVERVLQMKNISFSKVESKLKTKNSIHGRSLRFVNCTSPRGVLTIVNALHSINIALTKTNNTYGTNFVAVSKFNSNKEHILITNK